MCVTVVSALCSGVSILQPPPSALFIKKVPQGGRHLHFVIFSHLTLMHCVCYCGFCLIAVSQSLNHRTICTFHYNVLQGGKHLHCVIFSHLTLMHCVLLWLLHVACSVSIPQPPPSALFITRCRKAVNISTVVPLCTQN